jgi:hypothetical protein
MAKKAFKDAYLAAPALCLGPDFFTPCRASTSWSANAVEPLPAYRRAASLRAPEINGLLGIGAKPARKGAAGGQPVVALASDRVVGMVQRFLRIT